MPEADFAEFIPVYRNPINPGKFDKTRSGPSRQRPLATPPAGAGPRLGGRPTFPVATTRRWGGKTPRPARPGRPDRRSRDPTRSAATPRSSPANTDDSARRGVARSSRRWGAPPAPEPDYYEFIPVYRNPINPGKFDKTRSRPSRQRPLATPSAGAGPRLGGRPPFAVATTRRWGGKARGRRGRAAPASGVETRSGPPPHPGVRRPTPATRRAGASAGPSRRWGAPTRPNPIIRSLSRFIEIR